MNINIKIIDKDSIKTRKETNDETDSIFTLRPDISKYMPFDIRNYIDFGNNNYTILINNPHSDCADAMLFEDGYNAAQKSWELERNGFPNQIINKDNIFMMRLQDIYVNLYDLFRQLKAKEFHEDLIFCKKCNGG